MTSIGEETMSRSFGALLALSFLRVARARADLSVETRHHRGAGRRPAASPMRSGASSRSASPNPSASRRSSRTVPAPTTRSRPNTSPRRAPDGHTLLIGPEVAFVVNPSLYARLPYDPVKDFVPVSGLVTINHALITHPSLPVANVKELIEHAKKKPGELNYGTFGVGSSGHLNMELLQATAGVKFQPVHYKGATPALTDVMAGHIQMMFISVGSAVPQWRADKVKLSAIGGGQAPRAACPTYRRSRRAACRTSRRCRGSACSRPPARRATSSPSSMPRCGASSPSPSSRRSFLERQYFQSIAGTPEQLADYLKSEEAKWSKVVRDAKIKGE